MDILTHTISGFAIGTTVASFSNKGCVDKLKIILISGFAGALPDFDAISLWSGFDATIGDFFNLTHSGKEIYSAKFWYSHHGFLHSIFASILLAGLIVGLNYVIYPSLRKNNYSNFIKKNNLFLIGFILGFVIHLIEDIPTPASSWGGINLFWPSKSYIGGTGDVWWWNNYDIFLIVTSVLILNSTILIIKNFIHLNSKFKIQIDLRKITTGVFVLGFVLVLFQVKTREFDFSYSEQKNRYQEFELKSKELQKEILGDKLYSLMEKFDNKLKFYF